MHDQVPPQKRQHDEIGPDQDLEIVPDPGRCFDKEDEKKNRAGAENKRNFFRLLLPPAKTFFPNAIAKKTDQRQHQRHQNAEIEEPESEEGHCEVAFTLRPAPVKFENRFGTEMITNGPDKKGCRKQGDKKHLHNVSSDWHVADDEKTDEQNTKRH